MGKFIRTAEERQASLRKTQDKDEATARKRAAKAGVKMDGALFVAQAFDKKGLNPFLVVFPDRIERTKPSTALLMKTPADVEVIPLRSISTVEVKRAGALESEVLVYTAGPVVVFKLFHDAALGFRDVLEEQLVTAAAQPTAGAASAQPSVVEQIGQLGVLKEAGILTEAEFEAKKSEMLARL